VKTLKISHQLFLLIGAMMIAFSFAIYLQVKSSAEAIYVERYDMLRAQAETAHARAG
jgi:methyl-accepting chemotaxis protein